MPSSKAEGFYRYLYPFAHIETLELKKGGKLIQRVYESEEHEKDSTPYIDQIGQWELSGGRGVNFEEVFIISRIVGDSVIRLSQPEKVSMLTGLYFEHQKEGLVIRVFDEADMAYKKIK